MAKVKVHTASFPYVDITATSGSLFIKTTPFQTTGECVLGSRIKSIDAASEESVKKIGGTLGWSVVGGAIAGPVGLLAGALLGGKGKDVTFVAELDDGRKFMGTVDNKSFTKLKAESMRF
ncbi:MULTISPECIES: hypothetical protein [Vibrio]|jgi:hypothetical protein|uniref:hypothetical protein n=1 Tax=Vibrio TaxID=662 RepID=UPI000C86A3A0|nr:MULTISPECIES: hypothetical protein [Vibrio]EGQ8129878.1 hypothetical protein [Vibrio parahaemolyticus]EGQ8133081.1 hypothetical protein [Vibrio parahaemolyticus]EGQ8277922.1 hypothetical protein [Vibrio parahaemolyticus]EGQ8282569.1 hypothetical protein [Vibrio parahaemolyticus]EGQ8716688.1 hypothetical protein [Vibrio parahaemolyticus]